MELWSNLPYLVLIVCTWFTIGDSHIGCYTCQSLTTNATNIPCGDPFNSSKVAYAARCMQGMSGRTGEFPAHFCIKMNGESVDNKQQLLFVRTCSIKTMGHQCGEFLFEDIKYKGCVSSCAKDACNNTDTLTSSTVLCLLTVLALIWTAMREAF